MGKIAETNHKIKIGAFGKFLTCDGGKTKMYSYRNFFLWGQCAHLPRWDSPSIFQGGMNLMRKTTSRTHRVSTKVMTWVLTFVMLLGLIPYGAIQVASAAELLKQGDL